MCSQTSCLQLSLACCMNPIYIYIYIYFYFFFFFMRTNLCNVLVVQENSYSIANINLETIDTVQKIIQ